MSLTNCSAPVGGDRYLRAKEVCFLLGISKSTLYKFIGEGKFLAPMKFGPRTSVWLSSQVQAFIGSKGAQE
ncbi:helix-turn-helix transcriptional regulator [Fundidesulfovibrio putealis]|uniref:helix-turn-helix transcriptional regulator n=1 Tax=Fundidesulfovibrio putealis TaxID=270496 RepID=UPI0006847A13|nr:AlpA family phage regulatory protein [Fundidesulfovibrio putealis]